MQPTAAAVHEVISGRSPLLQVTSVTLEDLPGCSLSTLAQCTQLRFLSLRRCGLTALESVSQLRQLAYVDVQVDDEVISSPRAC